MFGKEKKNTPAENGEEKQTVPEQKIPVQEAEQKKNPVPEEPAPEQAEKTEPEDALAKITAELAETREKLLYLQADYQNYRRRMIKELSDARQIGVIGTLDPFLRVADFLGMADSAAQKSDNIEAIRQGLAMILKEFAKAFDDLGVKKVDSSGKPFNPDTQEAVLQEASETVPEGVVIKEWCPAYMLGDRCIRAAKVVVSTGIPRTQESPSPEAENPPEQPPGSVENKPEQEA